MQMKELKYILAQAYHAPLMAAAWMFITITIITTL